MACHITTRLSVGLLLLSVCVGCDSVSQFAEVVMDSGSVQDAGTQASLAETTDANEVVLMKFGAKWCGPCRQIDEELDRLEPTLSGQGVRIERIDVSRNQQLAQQFKVRSIPKLVLLHDGEIVDERVGYCNQSELRDWIESYGVPAAGRNAAGSVNTNPYVEAN